MSSDLSLKSLRADRPRGTSISSSSMTSPTRSMLLSGLITWLLTTAPAGADNGNHNTNYGSSSTNSNQHANSGYSNTNTNANSNYVQPAGAPANTNG